MSFSVLVCYVLLCFGGGFATMPSFVLDVFGPQKMSTIYGTILTAWAAAGDLRAAVRGLSQGSIPRPSVYLLLPNRYPNAWAGLRILLSAERRSHSPPPTDFGGYAASVWNFAPRELNYTNAIKHVGILKMDEEQRFAFDTWGFLTVEDAITPEQVADLKATVDAKGPELHSQHADRGGFWSQTFVDLLDVPVISEILAEIYGGQQAGEIPPFRIDHINVHTHGTFNKNLAGGTIHGGNGRLLDPNRPHELGHALLRARPRKRDVLQRSGHRGVRTGRHRV